MNPFSLHLPGSHRSTIINLFRVKLIIILIFSSVSVSPSQLTSESNPITIIFLVHLKILLTQVPLNLITATTLMLVKSGQLEDRGLVFGLLSLFLLLAAMVAASIETKEEKRE